MSLGIVQTNYGKCSGLPCRNPSFTLFKGIPFAKPPVGDLRFREPEPPEPWDGIRVCRKFAPAAMQNHVVDRNEFYRREFSLLPLTMSEDCLCLNVWTPAETGNEKLPVMVWIHGGAYVNGCAYEKEFDGEIFCRHGVLLVTIAYRLGPLGFLAHPGLSKRSGKGVSGNYGLLDSLAALKWVKENIGAFGGNPENVTVFGQSAGGGIVQALITSEMAKGLFQKAIVQSAAGLKTMGGEHPLHAAEENGAELCRLSGLSFGELLGMDAGKLTMLLLETAEKHGIPFTPNVDGYAVTEDPGRAIAQGKHHDIPYLTGGVAKDGELWGGPEPQTLSAFEESLKQYGPRAEKYRDLFRVKNEAELAGILPSRLRAHSMLAPLSWAKAHLKLRRSPVYTYYFDRDMPGGDGAGAFHSSELWYLFGTLDRCWRPFGEKDRDLSELMISYWTNFAKRGDPNGEGLAEWPAFTEERPVSMCLNERRAAAENLTADPIVKGIVELLLDEIYGK